MYKIYKITFNQYTNALCDTVCYYFKDDEGVDRSDYLSCVKDFSGQEGYIMIMTNDIAESLKAFQKYGDGIKLLEYIGSGVFKNFEEK